MLSKTLARRLYKSTTTTTTQQPFSTSTVHHHNNNSSSSASSIASSFLSRCQSQGPQTRTQILDANQLQLLSLTLDRPSLYPSSPALSQSCNPAPPPPGTPIPPGYHLVYFTPAFLESELGADGTDTSYNPQPPFTRRMWAGGEVSWPRNKNSGEDKPNLLRVGQTVHETTRVLSAEPKVVRKTGEEMIVVGVEKTLANEYGVAVVDRRNWLFRPALPYPPAPKQDSASPSPSPQVQARASPQSISDSSIDGTHTRVLTRSPVTLFRFSALTFNPHKIHYDVPWARDVEGHRNIVVHGPLNLISILDLWRDVQYKTSGERDSEWVVPQSISYRATSPLYADEEYRIDLEGSEVNIYNHSGTLAMKAEIRE